MKTTEIERHHIRTAELSTGVPDDAVMRLLDDAEECARIKGELEDTRALAQRCVSFGCGDPDRALMEFIQAVGRIVWGGELVQTMFDVTGIDDEDAIREHIDRSERRRHDNGVLRGELYQTHHKLTRLREGLKKLERYDAIGRNDLDRAALGDLVRWDDVRALLGDAE